MSADPFAEILRKLLGRPLEKREERALEAELENLPQDTVPCVPGSAPEPALPLAEPAPPAPSPGSVSAAGVALIKQFEGCARRRPDGRYEAYPDPATGGEPWTIGWGATGADGLGGRIQRGTVWTGAQCDARLESDLARFASEVATTLGTAPTSQAQFDALVSFHYNTGAIARATLTARHKAGDHAGAAGEFSRWTRAGGRVLPGLVRRRQAEAEMYRSGA